MKCPECGHHFKMGQAPKVSDDELRAAFSKHDGVGSHIALSLGMKVANCNARLRKLGLKPSGKNWPHQRPDLTLESLQVAYGASGGTIIRTARYLGVSSGWLYEQAKRLGLKSSRGRAQTRQRIAQIAEAIAVANGNYTEAAEILRVSRQRVQQMAAKLAAKLEDAQEER